MTYKDLIYLKEMLDANKISYELYINNKNKFIYSLNIKKNNEKIFNFLEYGLQQIKNKELNDSLIKLKLHLKEWLEIWNIESNQKKPSPEDQFLFHGYTKYPKKIDKIITNLIKL